MIRNTSIGNNEGTYGGGEAIKAIGTSEPAFANSEIYIDASGNVQYRGCRPNRAPGRFRWSEHKLHLTKQQKAQLDDLLA